MIADDIEVKLLAVRRDGSVDIGIEAPKALRISRVDGGASGRDPDPPPATPR
jgi:hypothetical protein